MKKLIGLLLVMAMVLCGIAAAENQPEQALPQAGITFHLPQAFQDAQGVIMPYGGYELSSNSGVYFAALYYVGMTGEAYASLNARAEELTEEEIEAVSSLMLPLVEVLAIDGDRDFADLNAALGGGLDESLATEIASVDGVTFYAYAEAAEALPDFELADEYARLCGMKNALLSASEFYVPVAPQNAAVGTTLSFDTSDLDGNPVAGAELFSQHEITMINLWATWCPPCLGELSELDAINERLKDIDCAIVGIVIDAEDSDKVDKARGQLAERGAGYLNLQPPANLYDMFTIGAVPTSYFVDRSGKVIGEPIIGAAPDKYEQAVRALLEAQN